MKFFKKDISLITENKGLTCPSGGLATGDKFEIRNTKTNETAIATYSASEKKVVNIKGKDYTFDSRAKIGGQTKEYWFNMKELCTPSSGAKGLKIYNGDQDVMGWYQVSSIMASTPKPSAGSAQTTTPQSKSPCVKGSGVKNILYNPFASFFGNIEVGDRFALVYSDPKKGKSDEYTVFGVADKVGDQVSLKYVSSDKNIPYSDNELKSLDGLFLEISKSGYVTGEYCIAGDIIMTGENGSSTKKYKFEDVVGFKEYGKTSGGINQDDFQEMLSDLPVDSVLELEVGGNTENNIYFLLDKPYDKKDGYAVLKHIHTNDGVPDSVFSKPSVFEDLKEYKVGGKAYQYNINSKEGVLKLNYNGNDYYIKNITHFAQSEETEESLRSTPETSKEEYIELMKTNPNFRDYMIKRPGFFGTLFGKKNLGVLPMFAKMDQETYGDGYDKLKKGNNVSFVFIDSIQAPLRERKNYVAKLADKYTIKLKGVKVSDGTNDYTILIKKSIGEDEYEVLVKTTHNEKVQGSRSPQKTQKSDYRSKIKIRDYKAS